jgi:hypothetical protein
MPVLLPNIADLQVPPPGTGVRLKSRVAGMGYEEPEFPCRWRDGCLALRSQGSKSRPHGPNTSHAGCEGVGQHIEGEEHGPVVEVARPSTADPPRPGSSSPDGGCHELVHLLPGFVDQWTDFGLRLRCRGRRCGPASARSTVVNSSGVLVYKGRFAAVQASPRCASWRHRPVDSPVDVDRSEHEEQTPPRLHRAAPAARHPRWWRPEPRSTR